jgi:peptidyl-prolyl cis-trans isomerase A (cyclophilin A)
MNTLSRLPGAFLTACILLSASLGMARAGIEVDIVTSRGTVVAELNYVEAPKAVANFVGLAEGKRAWIDADSGVVRREPFYAGIAFDNVVDGAGLKIAEAGFGGADAEEGIGYTFPDELAPELVHQPYVLAMSNSGPNTNGGRFYLSGGVSLPERDGVNVVIGSVLGTESRAVVDSILSAGSNETTIISMQIRRIDLPLSEYDEDEQDLPMVRGFAADIAIGEGGTIEALFDQVADSVTFVHRSPDLSAWQRRTRSFLGLDDPLSSSPQAIDLVEAPEAFYRFSAVDYLDVAGPSSFAGRVLTIESPSVGKLVYSFDSSGAAGIYRNVVPDFGDGELVLFEGQFEVREEFADWYGPYSFRMLLYLFDEELGGSPFNLIRGGFDLVEPSQISGRHTTEFLSSAMALVFEDRGEFVLSR